MAKAMIHGHEEADTLESPERRRAD